MARPEHHKGQLPMSRIAVYAPPPVASEPPRTDDDPDVKAMREAVASFPREAKERAASVRQRVERRFSSGAHRLNLDELPSSGERTIASDK